MRHVIAVGIVLAGLLCGRTAWASHDTACRPLPTTGQRAGTRPCNPRQDCLNATPRNPACNALSTSASCPTVENYNPRQECLAKLPPVPPVGIVSVEGGAVGSNRTYAGRPDMMRVRGQNVGMAGNTAVGEAGLVVGLVAVPNCAPPDCVGLAVQSAPNAEGARRFQVRAWHGHSQAEGTVQVVSAPPPQTPTPPQLAVPKQPMERGLMTPAAPAPIPVPYPVPLSKQAPGIGGPRPSPACTGNPAQVTDCEAKLAAYNAYMANLGRDVTLLSLPALYITLLQPLYPHVDLRTVQVGFSNRQQPNNATTDCSRIYFNSDDYVRKLAAGTLQRQDNLTWLYHELRHTEQCVEWGGRDFFAARWFKDFQIAVIQTRLQRDPQAFMKEVHDAQPMESDANARMRAVDAALPDGLVPPGSAGRR